MKKVVVGFELKRIGKFPAKRFGPNENMASLCHVIQHDLGVFFVRSKMVRKNDEIVSWFETVLQFINCQVENGDILALKQVSNQFIQNISAERILILDCVCRLPVVLFWFDELNGDEKPER